MAEQIKQQIIKAAKESGKTGRFYPPEDLKDAYVAAYIAESEDADKYMATTSQIQELDEKMKACDEQEKAIKQKIEELKQELQALGTQVYQYDRDKSELEYQLTVPRKKALERLWEVDIRGADRKKLRIM